MTHQLMNPLLFIGLQWQPQRDYRLKVLYHLNDDEIEIVTAKIFDYLNVDFTAVKSKSHARNLVEARQLAMYLIKKHLGCTLKYIGNYFGGRDHSTVIYALDTVKDMMVSNKRFNMKVTELEKHVFF
jgi:chromosomal replication initiation ATPase DnaA